MAVLRCVSLTVVEYLLDSREMIYSLLPPLALAFELLVVVSRHRTLLETPRGLLGALLLRGTWRPGAGRGFEVVSKLAIVAWMATAGAPASWPECLRLLHGHARGPTTRGYVDMSTNCIKLQWLRGLQGPR